MSTVMIIDDDAAVRAALRRSLEHEGYRVLEATEGKEALAMLETERPNLVLTDIYMPEMDGLEVVAQVRKRRPDATVVAMSGGGVLPARLVLEPAGALGAAAILQKPFSMDELRAYLPELQTQGLPA